MVVGGLVSFLYKELSSERDRTHERRALLRQMHSELLIAYNAAKRVRRTLRARVGCLSDSEPIHQLRVNAVDYQDQMDLLMDAQFTFEVYAKKAKDRELFFARGEALEIECEKIEGYLNHIIDEYEKTLASFAGTPPSKLLIELPRLAEFIGPFRDAKYFKANFKLAFREVLSALTTASLT